MTMRSELSHATEATENRDFSGTSPVAFLSAADAEGEQGASTGEFGAEDVADMGGTRPPLFSAERMAPIAAILAVGIWFAVMLWLAAPALGHGMEPVALVQFIGALCMPPALVALLWLVTHRTGTAQARQWARTAHAMREETDCMEQAVARLCATLETNRHALQEQARAIMELSDGTAEQAEAVSRTLAQASRTVDLSATTLRDAAGDAQARVETVLATVPRAHDAICEMVTTLDHAGIAAGERAAALETQFLGLIDHGREADRVASTSAQKLAAYLQRMEASSEAAAARLEQVTNGMSAAVAHVLDEAGKAVEESRRGIAAQGDAMLAMLNAGQAAIDRTGRDSIDAMQARIQAIETAIERIALRLDEEQGHSEALLQSLSGGVVQVEARMAALHSSGKERAGELSTSIDQVAHRVATLGESLRAGEEKARGAVTVAEELLAGLKANSRELNETLPDALDRLDMRVAASRQIVAESKPELMALVKAVENTQEIIDSIADLVADQRAAISRDTTGLLDTLDTGRARAEELNDLVRQAIGNTGRFAEDAAPRLVEALLRVRETASHAAEQARTTLTAIVPIAEEALERAGQEALRRAVHDAVRTQIAELTTATDSAVAAASRASEQLTRQMLSIAEATATAERGIEAARAAQEEADGENLARRMTGLVEALHSASIDILQPLSQEVSDRAWNAYLKGDRGIFTRRAVRILEPAQAREIVALYEEDAAFRESVNRYIHDFEAMLRQVMTLRDSATLSVTLLSSDVGKLYVALAQAIERLRT